MNIPILAIFVIVYYIVNTTFNEKRGKNENNCCIY